MTLLRTFETKFTFADDNLRCQLWGFVVSLRQLACTSHFFSALHPLLMSRFAIFKPLA